jgi:hypothetical protein
LEETIRFEIRPRLSGEKLQQRIQRVFHEDQYGIGSASSATE